MTDQVKLDEPEVVYVNPDGTTQGSDEEPAISGKPGKGRGRVEKQVAEKRIWSEDLIERAKDLIDQDFIDDGGDFRSDERNTVYWLDLDHLVAFEEADRDIDSNREFWSWFRDYRSDHGIQAKGKKKNWRDNSVSWVGGNSYTDSGRNYMTGWWGGWGYNSAGSDLARKLTIAVGAVQSIVEVINDTGHRFRVQLATNDEHAAPTSYTSFDERKVVVSPQALLDTSIAQDAGIEITAGYGLHEGSHVRFSMSILDTLTKPTELTPKAVAAVLFNLLEDVRIETKTSSQFPGFAGYFAKANSYLWDITKQHAPKKWGPELGDKMNAITAMVKWGTEYAEIVAKSRDKQLKAEYTWFSAWAERYRTELKDCRPSLIEALLHLQEDPETKQQMEDQAQKEKDIEAGEGTPMNDDQFKDLIKKLTEQLESKGGKIIEPCPSPGNSQQQNQGQKVTLTERQAQEVNKLLRENFEQKDPVVKTTDQYGNQQKITSIRPEETEHSRASWRKPGAMVSRLKSAFIFRKIAPEWAERMLRTGDLDEDQLWRITGHDLRVFQRKVTTSIPDTQVTMLIDMSGSMNGQRIEIAQELANTMLECLKSMRGVKVRVRGHTTTQDDVQPIVYRLWEQGDPSTRLGLISTLWHGWNHDGYAIDWCSQELAAMSRPGEDLVLIVLSDGKPNARSGYSGVPAMDHVRKVTEHWERTKGITTIQIAIDPEMRSQDQARMYRNWIQFEDEQRLPTQLTRLLIKLFGGASS